MQWGRVVNDGRIVRQGESYDTRALIKRYCAAVRSVLCRWAECGRSRVAVSVLSVGVAVVSPLPKLLIYIFTLRDCIDWHD